jgi:hypothetical protein
MWDDPHVSFYQDLKFVPDETHSVFLVGPSSRHDVIQFKWRADTHHLLRKGGYPGHIYIPEPKEDDWSFKETFPITIDTWERERILSCSIVLAWLCREQVQLPGRLTNFETGFLTGMAYAAPEKFKQKFIVGAPPDAFKVKSELNWIRHADITPYNNLGEMCSEVHRRLGSWMNY